MKQIISVKLGEAIPDNAVYIDKGYTMETVTRQGRFKPYTLQKRVSIFFYEVPIKEEIFSSNIGVQIRDTSKLVDESYSTSQLDLMDELFKDSKTQFEIIHHNG